MSKIIIGIHGLGNKPQEDLLKEWWISAIEEGFKLAGIKTQKFKLELVYWADLIYDQPESLDIIDKKDPYYLDEAYTLSPHPKAPEKDQSFRKKMLQFIENQLEKVFLNDDFSLNYKGVNDIIMHRYFKELEMYYSDTGEQITLKRNARQRLLKILEKYKFDDILLVGHSMGSIIAYDVLQFELKRQSVHTFITIGSPLGLPFIRTKIADEMKESYENLSLRTPYSISKAWLNFADLEDKVALNFDLSNDFAPNSKGISPIDFEIINDYENRGIKNPHKSFGYLRNPEFIQQLHLFLNEKTPFTFKNWLKSLQKIIHRIRYKQTKNQRNEKRRDD
jgi:hypothetical protein